jgi:DNA polymerase I-like protein with 3'-5' exonuclease and polymerase domains
MGDEEFQRQVVDGDVHQYATDLAVLPERWMGKKLVFLTLFGGGPPKLATDLKMPVSKAKIVQSTFFTNLPKLQELISKLLREWKEKGYLTGLDGRKLWVRAEHMLLVYLLQGLEAVVMKYWLRQMDRSSDFIDFHQVTVNHDEGQFLVREDHVDIFEQECQHSMDETNTHFGLKCPQAVDIKRGRTWAECH